MKETSEQQAVPVAQTEDELDVLVRTVSRWIGFSSSCIKSGESWTATCETMKVASVKALDVIGNTALARLTPIEGVAASASMALMYLQTGFIECPQCGEEVPTKDLDATSELASVAEPAPHDTPPATSPAIPEGKSGDGVGVVKYALEWRNGGEWKRDTGFAVPGNRHETRQITGREEALRAMAAENSGWIDTAEHRLVEVVETVIGYATQKGRHIVTDPVLLAPDATQTREAEGHSFEALERFIADHEGNDETSDGLDVDRRARAAVSALRSVVSAALAACHSGDDDCTNGRVVTIDPDAFDTLNAALDRVGEEGGDDRLTGEEAWDVLVNVDDRTSPEEHPDMCLITRDELIGFMDRAALNARGGA